MRFVDRDSWGAAYPQGSSRIPGPVRGVTLHWEGPGMGGFPHSRCARKVRTIERYHAVNKGWAGIAYSLVVCPHGYVFEGRGAGVRSAANGTSSIGGNDQWYAICYLGGVGDPFTDAGKQAMTDAIGYLRSKGAGDAVNGHRDHHPTECPGDAIYGWVKGGGYQPKPRRRKPNRVQAARDGIEAQLRVLEQVPASRTAVARMAARIRVALAKGPKS